MHSGQIAWGTESVCKASAAIRSMAGSNRQQADVDRTDPHRRRERRRQHPAFHPARSTAQGRPLSTSMERAALPAACARSGTGRKSAAGQRFVRAAGGEGTRHVRSRCVGLRLFRRAPPLRFRSEFLRLASRSKRSRRAEAVPGTQAPEPPRATTPGSGERSSAFRVSSTSR